MKRFPELGDKSQRGSKPRCHLFTEGSGVEVAARLTTLVKPYGSVSMTEQWMPAGFDDVEEAQLHQSNALIPDEMSRKLKKWWFKVPGGSAPNWDIVSQCVVGNGSQAKRGLLLVEAKAHDAELEGETGGKKLRADANCNSRRNHKRIGRAIEEANVGLRSLTGDPGWTLSRDNCYQMANRFAWAWKLVDLGMPVVLVYLGFLDATEMSDKGAPFHRHADWVECVKKHAMGKVPEGAWDRSWVAPDGTSFVPRIMSVRQSLTAARIRP